MKRYIIVNDEIISVDSIKMKHYTHYTSPIPALFHIVPNILKDICINSNKIIIVCNCSLDFEPFIYYSESNNINEIKKCWKYISKVNNQELKVIPDHPNFEFVSISIYNNIIKNKEIYLSSSNRRPLKEDEFYNTLIKIYDRKTKLDRFMSYIK